jgi:hypothetical protein
MNGARELDSNAIQIQLVVGFQGHKAHLRPLHRFGDRLRVQIVILVGFNIRANKLRSHEPYLMDQLAASLPKDLRRLGGCLCKLFLPGEFALHHKRSCRKRRRIG